MAVMENRETRSLDRAQSPGWRSGSTGLSAVTQLLDAGLGRGAIELRLARGRLHRVHAGVYAVGHPILTAEGRWMAAVLSGGAGAVLSHRSAAAHWGIRPEGSRQAEVTVASNPALSASSPLPPLLIA